MHFTSFISNTFANVSSAESVVSILQFFQDVEYFDFKYENSNNVTNIDVFIVNNDKHIFYRDVYVFIDKLKNLIKNSIDEQRVRELLFDCFKKNLFEKKRNVITIRRRFFAKLFWTFDIFIFFVVSNHVFQLF